MKTMRSTDRKRIFRVTDEEAAELYHNGDANYVTKEEWKREVRDVDKNKTLYEDAGDGHMLKVKSNKPSKAQKRQTRKTL